MLADEDLDTTRLTQRQRQILTVIRTWALRHGYSPSTREIADAVGLASTSSVSRHLRRLENLGLLRRGRATRPVDVRMFLRPADRPPAAPRPGRARHPLRPAGPRRFHDRRGDLRRRHRRGEATTRGVQR